MIAYENDVPVGTVDFVFPDEGEDEPTTTRDKWTATPVHEKCRQRFAVVPRGPGPPCAENGVGFLRAVW